MVKKNYIYVQFFVGALVHIKIANVALEMTYCVYDRFLNGNLIKSPDSYTFSSLSSLEIL